MTELEEIETYARDGSAPHQIYLSRLYMTGIAVLKDTDQAMHWLNKAIAQEDSGAYAERAVILSQGFAGEVDRQQAWQDLLYAAQAGHPGAVRQIGAIAAMIGDTESAAALFQASADTGDEAAQLLLGGLLHEEGDPEASYWFHAAGDNPLAQLRIETLGLEKPAAKEPAKRPVPTDILQTLEEFDPFDHLPIEPENKHSKPDIYVKRAAVPEALCQYVMAMGAAHIRQSDVVDPDTGKAKVDPYRTAWHHQFIPALSDFAIAVFDHRVADHSGTRVMQGEPLNLLVYRPGQEYKPHWDFLVDTMDESFGRLERSGNRITTALVTLDDGFEGGATRFTRLNIDVKLDRGDMLVFANLDDQGRREDDSMHAGLPVTAGVKWLASKWIRQKDYVH